MHDRVLIYGRDTTLLMTRELILRRAGLDVCRTTDHTAATRILAAQPVHLLILCHTLRESERNAILSIAHSLQKDLKTLLLVANPSRYTAGDKDATLSTLDGPQTLLAAVCKLINLPACPPHTPNPSTGPDPCHNTPVP